MKEKLVDRKTKTGTKIAENEGLAQNINFFCVHLFLMLPHRLQGCQKKFLGLLFTLSQAIWKKLLFYPSYLILIPDTLDYSFQYLNIKEDAILLKNCVVAIWSVNDSDQSFIMVDYPSSTPRVEFSHLFFTLGINESNFVLGIFHSLPPHQHSSLHPLRADNQHNIVKCWLLTVTSADNMQIAGLIIIILYVSMSHLIVFINNV